MLRYSLRRLLQGALAFMVISYVLWFLGVRGQGIQYIGTPTTYLGWVTAIVQGNWGEAIQGSRLVQVRSLFSGRVLPTMLLLVPALIIQQILSLSLSLISVRFRGSFFDTVYSRFILVFAALPAFWLGLMGVEIFCVLLHWVPFLGLDNLFVTGEPFGTAGYWAYFHTHLLTESLDVLNHLILPISLLVLATFPADSQFTRTAMLEVMSQEFIRAARARGIRERAIIWRHALRNAILPLITNIGVQIPRLVFIGAIIEFIFAIPGLGELFCANIYRLPNYNGIIQTRDIHIIILSILLFAFLTVLCTVLADIAYALADPRIRERLVA